MAYPWFKFYGGDFLTDAKMLSLSATERSCWLTILCFASAANERGEIHHLTEEGVIAQSGVVPNSPESETLRGVLKKFEKLQMIRVDNAVITVLNWGKRQQASLTPYERLKRHREKKRNDAKKITTDRDIEVDKENTGARKRPQVKKKSVDFTPLGAEVVKAFEDIDSKNKTYYANKTQRGAADFLVSEHGLDKVLAVVKLLPKTNGSSYFPTITSPHDLKEKWSKLESALIRKKGESTSKGRGLA